MNCLLLFSHSYSLLHQLTLFTTFYIFPPKARCHFFFPHTQNAICFSLSSLRRWRPRQERVGLDFALSY